MTNSSEFEEPPPSPCVGSGLCCKTGPCPYGEWDAQKRQCAFLETDYTGTTVQSEEFTIYRCGRYEFIKQQPGADVVPAFGAGCCMSLFNDNRRRIIRVIIEGSDTVALRNVRRSV